MSEAPDLLAMLEVQCVHGVDIDYCPDECDQPARMVRFGAVESLTAQRDQARGIAVELEQQLAAAPSVAAALRDAAAELDELGLRQAGQVVLRLAAKREAAE
jgi:hypothetical protein